MAVTVEPALISPDRLGALLHTRRHTLGVGIPDLVDRSGGRFTTTFLTRAEQGLVLLDDVTAQQLTELYDLDQGPIIPERKSRLVVDLPGRRVEVGSQSSGLAGSTKSLSGDELVDAVLERYLSLLYLLRDIEPGTEIPIRDDDLGVLGESLEIELALLERRLGELMLDSRVDVRTRSLIGRFLLPNAGLLVAATVVGSFLITSTSPDEVVATEDAFTAQGIAPAEQLVEAPSFPSTTIVVSGASDVEAGASTGDATPPQQSATSIPDGTTPETPIPETATPGAGTPEPTTPEPTTPETTTPETTTPETTAPETTTPETTAPETDTATEEANTVETTTPEAVAVPTAADPAALGAAAEDLIAYNWQSILPEWTVIYMPDRPGYRGLTFPQAKRIEIYLDADDTPRSVAEILAHELGHAVDVTYFDSSDRSQWIQARQMPAVWWAGDGLTDFSVGAGDFAEAVAKLWTDSPSNSTYGDYTAEQLELARQLIPK